MGNGLDRGNLPQQSAPTPLNHDLFYGSRTVCRQKIRLLPDTSLEIPVKKRIAPFRRPAGRTVPGRMVDEQEVRRVFAIPGDGTDKRLA